MENLGHETSSEYMSHQVIQEYKSELLAQHLHKNKPMYTAYTNP